MLPITHVFPLSAAKLPLLASVYDEFSRCGCKNVVLQCTFLNEMIADFNKVKIFRQLLADTGMSFCDSHAPFNEMDDLSCPFEVARPVMLERKILSMKIAASFGVTSMTFHTGHAKQPDCPLDKYRSYLYSSLDRLLPVAEELGITMAIENIWYPNNTAKELIAAIEKFPSDYLGICYDSGHANITSGRCRSEENSMAKTYACHSFGEPEWNDHLLEDVLPHITCCHLHDNNAVCDEHLLPGLGNVDWPKVVSLLKQAPRLKCIQNESVPKEGCPVSVSRTVETFNNLFK